MTQRIIMALLVLLGFSACSKEAEEPNRAEYGCPYVDFHISGRVTDSQANPVPGIIIGTGLIRDMAISDSDGNFTIDQTGSTPDILFFTDMDGKKNGGEFSLKELDVKDRFEQTAVGSGWHQGSYKAELGDIALSEAGKTEEED